MEQTKRLMGEMKLSGMLATLEHRSEEALSNGWGPSEFLSALILDEKIYREDARIKRRIKQAQFRTDAHLERFDFSAKRNIPKAQISELKTLRFIKAPLNVLLMGPTGVGKTYLATAIGNYACREGYSVLFMGMNLFIERSQLCRLEGTFLKFREKLIKADLLILDDLGIKGLTDGVAQDLYDVLEERYQEKSTLITSQLPIENWKEVIPDPIVLEAILDRLIHGAVRLEMNGESYRKRRARREQIDKEEK